MKQERDALLSDYIMETTAVRAVTKTELLLGQSRARGHADSSDPRGRSRGKGMNMGSAGDAVTRVKSLTILS